MTCSPGSQVISSCGSTSLVYCLIEDVHQIQSTLPRWAPSPAHKDATISPQLQGHVNKGLHDITPFIRGVKFQPQTEDRDTSNIIKLSARFGSDEALVNDFAQIYNAETFGRAMRARGMVRRSAASCRWEAPLWSENDIPLKGKGNRCQMRWFLGFLWCPCCFLFIGGGWDRKIQHM